MKMTKHVMSPSLRSAAAGDAAVGQSKMMNTRIFGGIQSASPYCKLISSSTKCSRMRDPAFWPSLAKEASLQLRPLSFVGVWTDMANERGMETRIGRFGNATGR